MKNEFKPYQHYNTEIEKAVLGSIILEPNSFCKVQGVLTEECFYTTGHQMVFKALSSMWRDNEKIDLYMVVSHIVRHKLKLPAGDEPAYFVTQLTHAVVTSAHIETHSLTLRELWIEREIIRIKTSPDEKGDALQKIARLKEQLDILTHVKSASDWSDTSVLVMELLDHVAKMEGCTLIGNTTGFPSIDLVTSGFEGLSVLAARPGGGKTALMLKMALAQAQDGITTGILSLEMPKKQLTARLLSLMSGIPFKNIWRSQLTEEQKATLNQYANVALSLPLFIDDTASMNMNDIRAKAGQLIYRKELKSLWIDYVQLIEPDDQLKNAVREQQVAKISRMSKVFTKQTGVSCQLLAQLNRAAGKDGTGRPQLHHLRESGALEQDADGVMLLHRDWAVGIKEDEFGNSTIRNATLDIAKWRNGETGEFELDFNPQLMEFSDKLAQEAIALSRDVPKRIVNTSSNQFPRMFGAQWKPISDD